ncbi:MAG: WG repeat-containing protein [Lewinellaceae bacterium]|nr:WG repeat-containing protein [Lewinellaceae bacterium]
MKNKLLLIGCLFTLICSFSHAQNKLFKEEIKSGAKNRQGVYKVVIDRKNDGTFSPGMMKAFCESKKYHIIELITDETLDRFYNDLIYVSEVLFVPENEYQYYLHKKETDQENPRHIRFKSQNWRKSRSGFKTPFITSKNTGKIYYKVGCNDPNSAGLIDQHDNEIIPCGKYTFREFYYGSSKNAMDYIQVRETRGAKEYAVIDTEGNIVVPFGRYDEFGLFFNKENGFLEVKKGDKKGFVNDKFEEVIPCRFDAFWGQEADYFIGRDDDKMGVYALPSGEEIIPPEYRYVTPFGKDHFLILREESDEEGGDYFQCIDARNRKIIYQKVKGIFHGDSYAVQSESTKLWAMFNEERKQITGFNYEDFIKPQKVGDLYLCKIKRNGKYGYIDVEGRERVAPKYDELSDYFFDGYGFLARKYLALAREGKSNRFFIDPYGEFVISYEARMEELRRRQNATANRNSTSDGAGIIVGEWKEVGLTEFTYEKYKEVRCEKGNSFTIYYDKDSNKPYHVNDGIFSFSKFSTYEEALDYTVSKLEFLCRD